MIQFNHKHPNKERLSQDIVTALTALENDDVDFIYNNFGTKFTEKTKFKNSEFMGNYLCRGPSLLAVAAFYGSEKCFNFLFNNIITGDLPLDSDKRTIFYYALHGGNRRIIFRSMDRLVLGESLLNADEFLMLIEHRDENLIMEYIIRFFPLFSKINVFHYYDKFDQSFKVFCSLLQNSCFTVLEFLLELGCYPRNATICKELGNFISQTQNWLIVDFLYKHQQYFEHKVFVKLGLKLVRLNQGHITSLLGIPEFVDFFCFSNVFDPQQLPFHFLDKIKIIVYTDLFVHKNPHFLKFLHCKCLNGDTYYHYCFKSGLFERIFPNYHFLKVLNLKLFTPLHEYIMCCHNPDLSSLENIFKIPQIKKIFALKDIEGYLTPLALAMQHGYFFENLYEYGDINEQIDGTPITFSIRITPEIIKFLISRNNWKPFNKDKNGRTFPDFIMSLQNGNLDRRAELIPQIKAKFTKLPN